MNFNKDNYTIETVSHKQDNFTFRAFRNRVYVEHPVNAEFQQLHIFAPEEYYHGGSIHGYQLKTAPIFMPNMVGGYMPGGLAEPEYVECGDEMQANTVLRALQHGYVVAVPAIRGRGQQDASGRFTGKAPACVVDYKAAVRYLHFFAEELPGDVSKIITNGTSAGGALSSLMGSTGNHPDYTPYLQALGAADAGDEVFAASCYCPIINLDHADMAYEWEFGKEKEYHPWMENGQPAHTPEMTEQQIQISEKLKKMFPAYLNSLQLRDASGRKLTLDEQGEGSFKEYVKQVVIDSARKALDQGMDVSDKEWLTVETGKIMSMDWDAYVKDITRMKCAPAFDNLSLKSAENDLFGTAEVEFCHFTDFGLENTLADGKMADRSIVKMLNPMNYIEDASAVKAKYFRVRHGECDRDTSLAISAICTLKLREAGCEVDYHSPWNVPHAGDYDLDELFAWIDEICK